MKIEPKHRAVARYLALGIPLGKVLETLGLTSGTSLERWQAIVKTPLFQEEIRKFEGKFEDALVEDQLTDSTMLRLKSLQKGAVTVLEEELEAVMDDDGREINAGTRLKAAFGILDRTGYSPKEERSISATLMINLSQDTYDKLSKKQELAPQPELIRER